jgi:ABC-type dipeptide/oligopeptide/nickel transport system permease subunit
MAVADPSLRLDTVPAPRSALSRLLRTVTRNRNLLVGSVMVLTLVVVGLSAPWLSPYDPLAQDLTRSLQPPGGEHLLGTDQYGRDVLSRVLHGTLLALLEIVLGVGMSVMLGVPIGLAAGYFGGRIDRALSWFMDILFAFPGIVLAILIVSLLGVGLFNMLLAIAIFSIPVYGRLTRNLTLALKQMDYTDAARALGAPDRVIMVRHILRNALAPLMVQATLTAGAVVLTAASLSFLGLGVQPPTPEWGAMVSNGRNFLGVATHLSLFPGLAITFAVMAFNLLGDGLRDVLDPRFR